MEIKTDTINSLKLNLFNFRAWSLIIMLLMPYKLTMFLYNFAKKVFYKNKKDN